MKKRRIGFAAWLLLTACLYFFENNTGTRIILLCSMLVLLIPALRGAFTRSDEPAKAEESPAPLTVKTFIHPETEESGDVRPYQPGDPIRRIHWKLSAKKDELLVRETEIGQETAETEQIVPSPTGVPEKPRRLRLRLPAAVILLCAAALAILPEARSGAQALCNRIFAASEALNAYVYARFPVPEDQRVTLAAVLSAIAAGALITLMIQRRSRLIAFGIMAGCTFFQTYFGIPFPAWINITVYGLLALWMMKRPMNRRHLLKAAAVLLTVTLATILFFPGVDTVTETASEAVRDHLSRMTEQMTGAANELPEGENETRHTHTQSLQTGSEESRTGREYRLVTVEEEQISMPQWVNWLKIILLMLLSVAVVSLPFTPFLLLNARKRKAEEARKAFLSDNAGEAVCAIFRQIIMWLNETGHSAGNLLYREWAGNLADSLPEGYATRFAACAADYEEAAYSDHDLPEEKRQRALELLKETETTLWRSADWKQRLRIRYWMCLCE